MRFVWIGSLLATVAAVAATIDNNLTEAQAALVVAACVIAIGVGTALSPVLALAQRPLAVAFACGLGLLTAATAAVPVLETLAPGAPVLDVELREVGAPVALPADLQGPVRLLLHAELPEPPAHLQLAVDAGAQHLETELNTTLGRVRLGRRGRGTVVQRHQSALLDADVGAGVHELRLTRAAGAWPVPLRLSVFREWLPDWVWLSAGALLLCLFAWIAAETHTGARVPGAVACALFFAFVAHYTATPDAALRPELGALFIAVLGATVVGPTLTAAGARLLRSPG